VNLLCYNANHIFDKEYDNAYFVDDSISNFEMTAATDSTKRFFDEFDRTVRESGHKWVFNTKADADLVKGAFAQLAEEQKGALKDVTTFTDDQLKIQDKLRKESADSAMKDSLGASDYAIAKIKEKFQIELDSIKGATDEIKLRAEIEKKMQAEVDAVYARSFQVRAESEKDVTSTLIREAEQRVNIERSAAAQVTQYWSQANVEKAAQTGGEIRNAGTAGEFVSSWDASGNYVGQFANGGSFMVGGSGGTDSQLVRFKASPDERVTIETPAQQRQSAAGQVINITLNGINDVAEMARRIQQHLRTNPNAFSSGMVRAG